jgi:hypothetical protein
LARDRLVGDGSVTVTVHPEFLSLASNASVEVAERVRKLVRQTCEAFEIRIIRGVVSKDHVHILVSAPLILAPSEKSDIGAGILGREAISAPQ